jgi:hypothetical protein
MCRVRRTRILLHLHIQLEGTVLRGKNVLKYYHALSFSILLGPLRNPVL